MLIYRLAGKVLVFALQIVFTLALVKLLAYVLFNLGPVGWLYQTRFGLNALGWLLHFMGWQGIEDTLDALIFMSYGSVLPLSIWICVFLTRRLKSYISEKQ
jgi:hypothetical protein